MTAPRVGVVSFWHETNGYSRRLADLAQWQEYELLAGEAFALAHRGTRSVVGGFLHELGERAVPILGAGAWPSGPTPGNVLELLLTKLEHGLRSSGRLDAIAVNLHGAMVAEGERDVETRVIERIRSVVGEVPIAAVLDLHGNPSSELARQTDVLVAYRTYPHVDMWERGVEAAGLLLRAVDGEHLVTTIGKLPFLTSPLAQGTDGALGEVIAELESAGMAAGLSSVSVLAGFAYADATRAGMSVLAVHDASLSETAAGVVDAALDRLARLEASGAFRATRMSPAEAVTQAIAATERPVVIVDLADNIGAGSAGDGTVLLEELIRHGAEDAVVVIADAAVVTTAEIAGVGATLDVELGGKVDDLHGAPVRVRARVESLGAGDYVTGGTWATGVRFEMGRIAILRVAGVTILVTSRATPPFHREHLTSVGIDPATAGIIVAKSAVAWRAAFGDDVRTVIEADTPGACPLDPWVLPRSHPPTALMPPTAPRLAGVPGLQKENTS